VIYEVTHRTDYQYAAPVSASYGKAHLLPRDTPTQTCRRAEVRFDPLPDDRSEHLDSFGNRTMNFTILKPHTTLSVTGISVVEVVDPPTPSLLGNQPWEHAATGAAAEAVEFRLASPHPPSSSISLHRRSRRVARSPMPSRTSCTASRPGSSTCRGRPR
jgi:transglutaminase-like putative cysteine protease